MPHTPKGEIRKRLQEVEDSALASHKVGRIRMIERGGHPDSQNWQLGPLDQAEVWKGTLPPVRISQEAVKSSTSPTDWIVKNARKKENP